jgi:hypothetical protein
VFLFNLWLLNSSVLLFLDFWFLGLIFELDKLCVFHLNILFLK